MQNPDKANSGRAMVAISEGQVIVHQSSPDEKPAILAPCEGIIVRVNGKEIIEETAVTEKDHIDIEQVVEVIPASIKVTTSDNKMEAYLQINPEVKIYKILRDQLPVYKLKPAIKEQKEETNPYTLEQVMQVIQKHGIVNIDIQSINDYLKSSDYGKVKIAAGTPPTMPRDESVELKIVVEKSTQPVIKSDGRVDYRERINSSGGVEKGDIIAEKISGQPGKPGNNIYGQPVLPREPRKISLQVGDGAQLVDNGTKAIAAIAGQPEIKWSGSKCFVSVQDNFVHPGCVDLSTGNIRFKGNLHIKGNVEQGMTVTSTGRIEIGGNITMANVVSGDTLVVKKNILASKVKAGAAVSSMKNLIPLINELHETLFKLEKEAIKTYAKLKNLTSFGKVVALLFSQKYKQVIPLVSQLVETAKDSPELPREVDNLAILLQQKLWGINVLKLSGSTELREILHNLSQVKLKLEILLDNVADAHIAYALNSKIEATGDVYISGLGCIDSKIIAGGSVYCTGIFRGGHIEAGGNVMLMTVGSKIGAPTLIKVPANKSIFIGKSFENVTLQIGEQDFRVNEPISNKAAHLDVYNVIGFFDCEVSNMIPSLTSGTKS